MRPSARLLVPCLAAIAGCYKGGDEPGVLTATSTATATADDGSAATAPLPVLDLGAPDPATTTTATTIDTETSGASTTESATTDTIPAPVCGDGVVEGDEDCDLGPMNSDTGPCTSACAKAQCGDGLLFAGVEECDHGTLLNNDSAACTKSCTKAKCGDGLLFLGVEECDNGEDNQAGLYGGCTPMTCTLGPHCGDHLLQLPEEECDQGQDNDDANTCSASCKWNGKIVFATSAVYSGAIGGVAAADDKCNTLAMVAGLANAGAFLAWLSDDKTSPAARMAPWEGRYILRDGTVIADNWDDLVDGTLDAPIRVDETGAWIADDATPYAWTGTSAKGLPVLTKQCSAWTTSSKDAAGRWGTLSSTDKNWSSSIDAECSATARILCIEQ